MIYFFLNFNYEEKINNQMIPNNMIDPYNDEIYLSICKCNMNDI